MAVSTQTTKLMYKPTSMGELEELVEIKSYPDLGATPTKLDSTTLSAKKFKTAILGLQEIPDLEFECNWDKAAFTKISKLTDQYDFELHFGEAGVDGKFGWKGHITVFATAGGVDEVRGMKVVLSAETEIVEVE